MPSLSAVTNHSPKYIQVRDALRDEIQRRYRPGHLLPTQRELARRFDTSLITIKRAVTELAHMGLVESVRGRGTVVLRPAVVDAHTGVSSWTDAMRSRRGEPRTAWKRIDRRRGNLRLRRLLGLSKNQTLTVIRRLRTLDGRPACLMTNWLATERVPDLHDLGFEGESLYETLADRYGLAFAYADEEVGARRATANERQALAIEAARETASAGVVMDVHRTSYGRDDRVLELACLTAPIDAYAYRVRLHAGNFD